MKNMMNRSIIGRNATVSLLLVLGIFFVMGFACGGSSTPPPSQYVGFWTGEDGSTITIRGDGSADYKSGNSSISGGSVTIDEGAKTLKISFASLGPSFTIDKAPSGDKMTLSSVVYKKGSGDSDSKSDKTSSSDDKTSGDAPSKSEAEKLVKATFSDFADAVDSGDFGQFYDNASGDFQTTYTKDQVKSTFNVFIENKSKALPSLQDVQSRSASFSNGPSIETEKGTKMMVADGEFASKPTAIKFETKYEWEKGEWKMLKFKIKM
ncbi:MAG TPA: hypothetical protein VHQ01_04585 [Pyrinomonadaceae bacterium]|nr:hypothetical protein [Pyrinomonadaceae bacterium]